MLRITSVIVTACLIAGSFAMVGCQQVDSNGPTTVMPGFAGGNGAFGESTAHPGYDETVSRQITASRE